MVFYILMAVSIGGGLAWAILLYAQEKRALPARLEAFRGKSHYYQSLHDRPTAFFHFWIPLPLLILSMIIIGIGSTFVTPEDRIVTEETHVLAPITDQAYIEASWCYSQECVTYMTKSGDYWQNMQQVYAHVSTITEGADSPTLNVTVTDQYNPAWWAPFGGPPTPTETGTNRVEHYDFQVPTGTVAIK